MIKNYFNVVKAVIFECKNWPSVVFAKVFNFKLDNIILRNGTKFAVNGKLGRADLSMLAEIWHKKFYTPTGFEINESDIVFDIGANEGFFAVFAAQKAVKGKVYAFEPVPYLAEKIKKTIELNNFNNIKIENLAVGETDENRIFYISKDHNGCHSLYERDGELEKIKVSVVDLEEYCENNNISQIDFLKLDCEGGEYEIIKKESIDFFKNKVRLISMEYHDDINHHTHEEIMKILQSNNFFVEASNGYIYAKNRNNQI